MKTIGMCRSLADKPAAGGGRWIDVSPERLHRWLLEFDRRHGVVRTVVGTSRARFEAGDGALAECHPPFPPLQRDETAVARLRTAPLVDHACRNRTVGVLLVRLGGYAAGVFDGPRLVASKVGSRPVHGRSKAGGQSQKRFQRRRTEQAREATRAAADVAARVLLPRVRDLDAVVLGGDRGALDAVRADKRLGALFALAVERVLDVPDPKRAVLERTPTRFRAVRIRIVDPDAEFRAEPGANVSPPDGPG